MHTQAPTTHRRTGRGIAIPKPPADRRVLVDIAEYRAATPDETYRVHLPKIGASTPRCPTEIPEDRIRQVLWRRLNTGRARLCPDCLDDALDLPDQLPDGALQGGDDE